MVSEHEDTEVELEDEDSNNSGPTTVIDKYFNFDMFMAAEPSITRVKSPNFDDLINVPVNIHIEPEKKNKYFYYRSDPSKSILLIHRQEYYYCGCTLYNAFPGGFNSCSVKSLQAGEQIYTVTIYLNKRMARTTSQRWRRECWERLAPTLRIQWAEHQSLLDNQSAEDYFNEHSTIVNGERVADTPRKPGRPINQEVLSLSDEDAIRRTKLTNRYAVYKYRRKTAEQENKSTSKIDIKLNEMYDEVIDLGGVPNGWIRY